MIIAQNLEQLLAPIAGDNPAGIYLKDDRSAYRPLRNSYNVAQTSLRKLTNNPTEDELDELQSSNQENWKELSSLLVDVVGEQSKDLECISWLTLAQLFTAQPYENLSACLKLMTGVITQFGEKTHPCVPDKKLRATDDAGRKAERAGLQLRPVVQLFGESEESCLLGLPLRMLPLVADIDYVDWRGAESQGSRADLQKKTRQALADEQLDVISRVLSIADTLEALEALDQAITKYAGECGTAKVSSSFLRHQLTANLNALKSLTDGVLVPWPLDVRQQADSFSEEENVETDLERDLEQRVEDVDVSETASISTAKTVKVAVHNGVAEPIYNRDQAFQQLRLIASYFARTEPQSPVSSMIEKVIRWGYTPLPDLINELVQGHDGLMGRIGELTGMNAEKVHIPGARAPGLVAPPVDSPIAPSQLEPAPQVQAVQQIQQAVPVPSTPELPVRKVADQPVRVIPEKTVAVQGQKQADAFNDQPKKKEIPSFLNLPAKEATKPEVKQKTAGPGGINLASLGIR